jgi:hypothetical protein
LHVVACEEGYLLGLRLISLSSPLNGQAQPYVELCGFDPQEVHASEEGFVGVVSLAQAP